MPTSTGCDNTRAAAKLLASVLLLASATPAWLAVAQDDGNPHHWDRQRRCDHSGYSPPCGICEGVGGIPYGDNNAQIDLASCVPVANQSSVPLGQLKRPLWPAQFTANSYSEVLIGPKIDPFCFQVFPSNTSEGKLCYRPDQGRQVYDMLKAKALRYDLNVETSVGKLQSTIIHQGKNFWVVNHLPWYAAGVHQCICTQIYQGGDRSQPPDYPIQFNWTNHLSFVGRERIDVEYGVGNHTLDHWAFGPHHVWTAPESGYIIRMWQPFNGLQVFPSGNGNETIDETLFDDIPPALCKKKGGAAIRIKCGDDGYPQTQAAAADSENPLVASKRDTTRAKTFKPRSQYRGDNFEAMSTTLNAWLQRTPASFKACSSFSATELQKLQAMLYLLRDPRLDDIYRANNDNRQIVATQADLKATWKELNALVEAHPDAKAMHEIHRDGHCHEAIMWYVHHLSEDVRKLLIQEGVTFPLLPDVRHMCSGEATMRDEAHARICAAYEDKVTCQSCHSNSLPPGHQFLKR